jgi:hypothetical protein
VWVPYKVQKYSEPSLSVSAASDFNLFSAGSTFAVTGFAFTDVGTQGALLTITCSGGGLTVGNSVLLVPANTNAHIDVSAEFL